MEETLIEARIRGLKLRDAIFTDEDQESVIQNINTEFAQSPPSTIRYPIRPRGRIVGKLNGLLHITPPELDTANSGMRRALITANVLVLLQPGVKPFLIDASGLENFRPMMAQDLCHVGRVGGNIVAAIPDTTQ
jgi:hypothetical protein